MGQGDQFAKKSFKVPMPGDAVRYWPWSPASPRHCLVCLRLPFFCLCPDSED